MIVPARGQLLNSRLILLIMMSFLCLTSWAAMFLMPEHSGHDNDFIPLMMMWITMIFAMMFPVVMPWIIQLSRFLESNPDIKKTQFSEAAFLSGYVTIWLGFSLAASLLQVWLKSAMILSTDFTLINPVIQGTVIIAAGIYQFSPLKKSCLSHCRSPLSYFLTSWKEGNNNAYRTGLKHGIFCTGCCWALMSLGFVFGIISIKWMAVITIIILSEKMLPWGDIITRFSGAFFIVYGTLFLIR